MRRLLKLVFVPLAACATAPPAPEMGDLLGEPPPFRALYRLECCGMQGLLLVVAHGASGTLLEVAGGPSGVGLAVWAEGDTVILRTAQGCLEGGQQGELPLPGGGALPFSEKVLASLLSGRLPGTGSPISSHRWLAQVPGGTLELDVVGAPSRWVGGQLKVHGHGEDVQIRAHRHHGRVPGEIVVRGARLDGTLSLVEFQPVTDVAPPPWLGLPRCGGS